MNRKYSMADEVMPALPPEPKEEFLPAIRERFLRSETTIVVLDDDPTGTQTCYDVTVLTSWNTHLLVQELKKSPAILFILTNSRSLPQHDAITLAMEIGHNLVAAQNESGRKIVLVSRSDSTLRGHFPAEVAAIAEALNISKAVTVLVPAFIEGGRFTIDDVHYILERDELVPVADTPFAKDSAFGYTHSDLKEWVAEKTKGTVKSEAVISISLKDIRVGGPDIVANKLSECKPSDVCIINACSHKDLEILVMGLLKAEDAGQTFIYRTSATFVPIRAGLASGRIFNPPRQTNPSENGSLVIVGSYVPKTTRQLEHLLRQGTHHSIEINVPQLLSSKETGAYAQKISDVTDALLSSGTNVILHTSRALQTGRDAESSLRINSMVSSFLVSIMKRLTVHPAFVVAKGGITASDLATKGLAAEKALILGQIIPGVPVWRMDETSKFGGISYVVFPGNVGDDAALTDVCKRMQGTS